MSRTLARFALLASIAMAGMIAGAATPSAHAATYTWSVGPTEFALPESWGVGTSSYGSLLAAGTGAPTLGTNTYTGSTTISSGTLQLQSSGVLPIPPTGAADLNFLAIPDDRPASPEPGASPATVSGTGMFTLTGTNSYSGGTTINGGTLTLANGSSWPGESGSASPTALAPIPSGPVFYLIVEGAGNGDSVRCAPCTGHETVLSAVAAAGGISQVSSTKMWIARPSPKEHGKSTILAINWDEISRRGIETTNYTLMPNDRLMIGEDPEMARTNLLAKSTAPAEKTMGIVSLTTSTVQSLNAVPGACETVNNLVDKGTFDDEPELKKVMLDMLRVAEKERAKAATKAAETKTDESEGKQAVAASQDAVEKTVGEKDNAPNNPAATKAEPKIDRYLGYRSKEEPATTSGAKAAAPPKPDDGKTAWTGPNSVPPHEMAMRPFPAYRIEPPDVISVEMLKLIPLPPYRAAVYDVLQIRANATQDMPLDQLNYYIVDADGSINLGPPWRSLKVQGMTIEETEAALNKFLEAKGLKDPDAFVQIARIAGAQPVTGQYLVAHDGMINLRAYGEVAVSGLTVPEAQAAIEKHLAKYLKSPVVSVDVLQYNSKTYYVITQGAGLGDNVRRLPSTGHDTVLDALAQLGGLTQISSNKIWVARPSSTEGGKASILPVDWDAIVRRAETATNYQLLPGDRVYIGEDPLITRNNELAKKTAPVERAMGIVSLTTSTVQSLNDTPGAGEAVKELLKKGTFDDDPELKRIVEETLRISAARSAKAAAKPAEGHKP